MIRKRNAVLLMSVGSLVVGGLSVQAQSFSLDENPFMSGGTGLGAEDEFGLTGGPGLAPSPSVFGLFGGDGTIVSPALGGLQHVPNGRYIDAFSTNHLTPAILNQPTIALDFSVDRLTGGLPGSASAFEFAAGQQPGDIFTTTSTFINPVTFLGTLGAGPFAGPLASAGGGGSNALTIDESAFGLVTAAGIIPPAPVPGGPITPGSHDNVDAYDTRSQIPAPGVGAPAGVYTAHSYFALNPDEAAAAATSAADIFDTAALAPGTAPTPFATSFSMGLDTSGHNTDSIDALIVFDGGAAIGGPSNGGPGAEVGFDFALFSLAPGSASLAPGALTPGGLSAADIFFTDFTGAFGVYAFDGDLGLLPGAPGFPFQNQSNVDALSVVPEPGSLALLMLGLGALSRRRRA